MRIASMLLVVLLALVSPAIGGEPARLVVFGDSLSDPGNHFVAYGTTAGQPFTPVPEASYPVGGHHFSNGATWVERLAADLGVPASGGPALRVPGLFTNYAVGRARARAGAPAFADHHLAAQVARFLADSGGQASSGDVYVIWIGANDVSDALGALMIDPSGTTSAGILQASIAATAQSIQGLWAAGARTFLIPNIPNLAITPVVRALGPQAQAAAAQLGLLYNDALDGALEALGMLPTTRFVRVDVNALFDAVVADPAAGGFTNVTDPCLTFGVVADPFCATPQRYLFWDGFHPTASGHALIAEMALLAINGD